MIRVILCDDHGLIRRGIRDTLADAQDIEVVGEAGDYTELRGLLHTLGKDNPCDVLVLDINMPGRSGLDVAHEIAAIRPGMPVVISSGLITDELREQAAAAGVRALLEKEDTFRELSALVGRLLAKAG